MAADMTDEELLAQARAYYANRLGAGADVAPVAAPEPAPAPQSDFGRVAAAAAAAREALGAEPGTTATQTWGGGGAASGAAPEITIPETVNGGRPEITIPATVIRSKAPSPAQTVQETVIGSNEAGFSDDPMTAGSEGRQATVAGLRAGPLGSASPQAPVVSIPESEAAGGFDAASGQLVLDPPAAPPRTSMEAGGRIADTYRAEAEVVARQSNAEGNQAAVVSGQLMDVARAKEENAQAAERAARLQEIENQNALGDLRKRIDEIREQKVDVRPLLSDKGFQFMAVLASALGGWAQGVGATRTNLGLDTLNGVLDREIEVQSRNIELGRSALTAEANLLEQQMRVWGNTQAAKSAAKLQLLEAMDTRLTANYTRLGIPIQQAQRARELIGLERLKASEQQKILAHQEQLRRAAAGAAMARLEKEREYRLKLRRLELDEAKTLSDIGETDAKAAKLRGEAANTGLGNFIPDKTMDPAQAASVLRTLLPDAPPGTTVTRGWTPLGGGFSGEDGARTSGKDGKAQPSAKEKLALEAATVHEIQTLAKEILKLRSDLGYSGRAGAAAKDAAGVGDQGAAELVAKTERLRDLHRELSNFGVLSGPEAEMARVAVGGNPLGVGQKFDFKLREWTKARVGTYKSHVAARAAQEAYVVNVPGQPPRVVHSGKAYALPDFDLPSTNKEGISGVKPPPEGSTGEQPPPWSRK